MVVIYGCLFLRVQYEKIKIESFTDETIFRRNDEIPKVHVT